MGTTSKIRFIALAVIALLVPSMSVSADSELTAASENQVFNRQIDIATPGPLGAVTVIGDSVLLGSALWGPTLPERLAERGWGPIKFRAGQGLKATGTSSLSSTYWIRLWRSQGWDAPNVIVNIGANDSGLCITDLDCARRRIQALVDEIGPEKTIWWPQVTRFYTKRPEQDTWNRALQEFADTYPNFHTWDWPAELDQYNSTDGTHLTANGYRQRSVRMAELFTLAAARGTQTSADVALPTPTQHPSAFVALPAQRVVDSRRDDVERRTDAATLRIDFGDLVPDDATAVALYVGAAGVRAPGYFAAGPCGQPTSGSTVNFVVGPAVGAPTIVALGPDADVCIFSKGDAEIVVDLQGAFVASSDAAPDDDPEPGPAPLRFTPLDVPDRLVDTRGGEAPRTERIVVDVPVGATAVALNLTAVRPSATGFLAAAPCGEQPSVANLNYRAGVNAAAFAIVEVSADSTVCIDRSSDTDVIVDITGTFAAGDGLEFVAVTPTRTLDTRSGVGGFAPIHGAGQTARTRVAPAIAEAVTGTLTLVKPLAGSFITAEACSDDASTSSVNGTSGAIVANSVTTSVTTNGRLCFTTLSVGHTVFDTTGWWVRT